MGEERIHVVRLAAAAIKVWVLAFCPLLRASMPEWLDKMNPSEKKRVEEGGTFLEHLKSGRYEHFGGGLVQRRGPEARWRGSVVFSASATTLLRRAAARSWMLRRPAVDRQIIYIQEMMVKQGDKCGRQSQMQANARRPNNHCLDLPGLTDGTGPRGRGSPGV